MHQAWGMEGIRGAQTAWRCAERGSGGTVHKHTVLTSGMGHGRLNGMEGA